MEVVLPYAPPKVSEIDPSLDKQNLNSYIKEVADDYLKSMDPGDDEIPLETPENHDSRMMDSAVKMSFQDPEYQVNETKQ